MSDKWVRLWKHPAIQHLSCLLGANCVLSTNHHMTHDMSRLFLLSTCMTCIKTRHARLVSSTNPALGWIQFGNIHLFSPQGKKVSQCCQLHKIWTISEGESMEIQKQRIVHEFRPIRPNFIDIFVSTFLWVSLIQQYTYSTFFPLTGGKKWIIYRESDKVFVWYNCEHIYNSITMKTSKLYIYSTFFPLSDFFFFMNFGLFHDIDKNIHSSTIMIRDSTLYIYLHLFSSVRGKKFLVYILHLFSPVIKTYFYHSLLLNTPALSTIPPVIFNLQKPLRYP